MQNNDAARGFFVGFVLATFISLIAIILIVNYIETMERSEAVKHGAAHYEVDAFGKSTFVWNSAEVKK